jgi:general secretion pathway protein M
VSLAKAFERLDTREQRLLRVLLTCVGVGVFGFVLFGHGLLLGSSREEDEALRNAITEITSSQPALAKADQRRQAVSQRYARPVPPLAAFVDGLAKESGIEIPETQERPIVPHGKRYEERSLRLQLRKASLGNLARFLEKLEQAGHPVVLSKLNIRKRISEPDSFDVELIVSAYDRKEPAKSESDKSGGEQPTEGAKETP